MILKQFEFQDEAVDWLVSKTVSPTSKKTLVLKAPTGSGKTVVLIKYIDKLLLEQKNTAVIWFCPGKGNLEEQSREKFQEILPSRLSGNLNDTLTNGFVAGSTSFINWEKVTKKDNKAITENEKDNLYDKIRIAHSRGTQFIIIIDEEHSNNTSKANDLLRYFNATHTVRVSATTLAHHDTVEYYEIDEQDVIDAGLITTAISVNENIEDNVAQDDALLLELADKKRKEILQAYQNIKRGIRPLVLIQFPNGEPEKIESVENKLRDMGYTRENGMVAAWLSGDKADVPENLTDNNSQLSFLFIKQAINTGWDCPRAKILVKLRENSSEPFQIQTIGRIRRMPEAFHYDIPILDMCYIYTFDSEYQAGLLAGLSKAYIPKRLFLKEKCKSFELPKELKDMNGRTIDVRGIYNLVYKHFVNTYNLTNNKDENMQKLKGKGYTFDTCLHGKIISGVFVHSEDMLEAKASTSTQTPINTHEHAFILRHTIDAFKTILGIKYEDMRVICDRLFSFKYRNRDKLLSLGFQGYYAFILNNEKLIKVELRKLKSEVNSQNRILQPRLAKFSIPLEELYHFDPSERYPEALESNAYEDYTTAYVTTNCGKSDPEIMFENYCNKSDKVDWVYKNGDSGQVYLSLVYTDGISIQNSFYPDYIVKLKSGEVWILETKGGQRGSSDQNIDIQVINKFETFKRFAAEHNLKWGFVRPMNQVLYLNNTEYTKDIHDEHWIRLSDCI